MTAYAVRLYQLAQAGIGAVIDIPPAGGFIMATINRENILKQLGIGYAVHAGQVTVADGTPQGELRLRTALRNDPALGIIRHADAGYERAIEVAAAHGAKIPMINMFA